jgi:hypothetical protein
MHSCICVMCDDVYQMPIPSFAPVFYRTFCLPLTALHATSLRAHHRASTSSSNACRHPAATNNGQGTLSQDLDLALVHLFVLFDSAESAPLSLAGVAGYLQKCEDTGLAYRLHPIPAGARRGRC